MYKIYSKEIIQCPCCNKYINLFYGINHLQSKQCRKIQDMMKEDELKQIQIVFIREINKIKSELKLNFKDNKINLIKNIDDQII